MKAAPFQYHAPTSLEDALTVLAEVSDEEGRILAGGQSLVPMMALRLAYPGHLVDINRIAGLGGIELEDDALCIGALARHADFHQPVIDHPLGRLLASVVRHIAHYPIRLRGTFCGSLAHADPSAEWCVVAATFDAVLELSSRSGTRSLPAPEFFRDVMTTALRTDEVLTSVSLPLPPAETRMGFYEFNRRAGDFALGMALVSYRLSNGLVTEPRIALGGIETTPRRLPEAEARLAGQPLMAGSIQAAADAAADGVDPLEDPETSAGYRRDLTRTVIKRAFDQAGRS